MSNLQIGSFVLNTELLIYLLAGVGGVLAVRLRVRGHENKEQLISIAWSAMFIWMLIWKGSLLIFDPKSVISQPQSLLFFDGGVKGLWLASIVSVGYSGFRYVKQLGVQQGVMLLKILLAGWLTIYSLLMLLLSHTPSMIVFILFLAAIAVLVILANPIRPVTLRIVGQWFGIMLVAGMLIYTVYGQLQSKEELASGTGLSIGTKVGQQAPDFDLVDRQGNSVKLSDYRGKTVMVNFWATWCKVCKTEMPHVEKLYDYYKDTDVAILSVNVTTQERSVQDVERYVDNAQLTFPILLDQEGTAREQYRVSAYPTTFVIDAEGIVRHPFVGAISFESMKSRIEKAMKFDVEA